MRVSILLLLLSGLIIHPQIVNADRAKPAVKIEVEVIVFEDGKVTVKGMPEAKMGLAKTGGKAESGKCCGGTACSKCCGVQKPSTLRNEEKMMTKATSPAKQDSKSMIKKVADSIMKLDANKDGRLNADEVQPRLKTPFGDVDANGDGYLDRGEVIRQIKRKMRAS